MRRLLLTFVGILIVLASILGIQKRFVANLPQQSAKMHIAASFYPVAYFAAFIGGDRVQVTTLTPATSEPHDYEPTTQDMKHILTSKLLVLNGGSIEGWGNKVSSDAKSSGVAVVVAGEGLATQQLTENGQQVKDPHIWLDPLLAKQEVQRITTSMIALDPTHGHDYATRSKLLQARLDTLNQSFVHGLAQCQTRDFVTSHAAFGYLASRYGLHQIAISGISPDEEPSSQKLAEITTLVKQQHIQYIFFESLVSPKLSDTIATETGAQTLVLDPLEGITEPGADYFSIQQQNLANLQKALICQP